MLKKELGLLTFHDVLHYFPFRYADRSSFQTIDSLQLQFDWVQLKGKIIALEELGSGRARRLVAQFSDGTGTMELVWFQGVSFMAKSLQLYEQYIVYGKVGWFNQLPQIAHPDIEVVSGQKLQHGMQPYYSVTEKLRTRGITNKSFSKITQSLFEKIQAKDIAEIIPKSFLQQYNLIPAAQAYYAIHFPKNELEAQQARHRLKWEELFVTQLRIALLRAQHTLQPGFVFQKVGKYFQAFYEQHLPFALTSAQKRVVKEIRQDMLSGHQMNRLLQGDVGSGKTMVALLSMLLAVDNGFQACLMAPTEILARQHYESLHTLLEEMEVQVVLLTGSVKGKERKQILTTLAQGQAAIAIGTHALIEDSVQFHNLGLAVIDEQHRFGVGQRARLWKKNEKAPHILVMTATPIPRTLAMTLYGDLENSVIDELPPGRKPIHTAMRSDQHRARIMDFIKQEIKLGRQAYIVYPLIEESEKLDYENLNQGFEQVKSFFPDHTYHIAIVHGRQPPDERERNMQRFIKGEAHILVATTVIEVGVNVPNASVMLIESAERFGLSQLHQLRGRVGRGADQSYCILLHNSRLSEDTKKRLNILVQTSNGFEIAEEDLKLRGPGDLYGTRQSGDLQLKIADISTDVALMEQARDAVKMLLEKDPQLQHYPLLRKLWQQSENSIRWQQVS